MKLLIKICLSILLLSFISPHAQAHWADLAVAEIQVGDQQVLMTLTFPTGLVADADDDGNGTLSATELEAHRDTLINFFTEKVRWTNAHGDQPATLNALAVVPMLALPEAQTNTDQQAHSTLSLTYRWADAVPASLSLHYDLFLQGVSTASCMITVFHQGTVRNVVLTPEQRTLALQAGHVAWWDQARSFVVLGAEHIWGGYDHILFLIALLLLGGTLMWQLKLVTAFTVAHSLTLGLAVLGLVQVPSQWVESLIALSIVYAASEIFWRKSQDGREKPSTVRWLVVFGFGLIHGLGFAGILMELNLAGSQLPLALASFNIGVELGQVVIVVLAFGMLKVLQLTSMSFFVRRTVAAGVFLMGMYWLVERVFESL